MSAMGNKFYICMGCLPIELETFLTKGISNITTISVPILRGKLVLEFQAAHFLFSTT